MEKNETAKNITKLILTNKNKMIREEDLRNLCDKSLNFDQIIAEIYDNLQKVGFELITSVFLDQRYYILTSEGKNDEITPSQYGTLALILALSKEVDENLKLDDLKNLFADVWNSDVQFLIENDYLRQIDIKGLKIIKITPSGKATMKNIIGSLQLKNLIDVFSEKDAFES